MYRSGSELNIRLILTEKSIYLEADLSYVSGGCAHVFLMLYPVLALHLPGGPQSK